MNDQGLSEERLAYALEGSSDGLWDWDIRTDEVYYSPRWEQMFGYPTGGAPRTLETFSALVHPDDLPPTFEAIQAYLRGEQPHYSREFRMRKLDGSTMWTQHRATALFDGAGAPVRMIGTTMDTTARKQAELALQRTTEMLEKTNRMARVGGWEIDLGAMRPIWSAMTRQIHEVPPDYVPDLDTAIEFYKQGESRERIRELVQLAIETGAPWDVELQLVTYTGRELWVRSIGEAVLEGGRCARLFGTFQDVSERRAREQELARAQAAAEVANEAKTEFLANMSHELRTPMNAIFGLAELLLGTPLSDTQRDYLDKLRDSSRALLHLINDILDISKIEAGQLQIRPEPFELGQLIDRLTSLFELQARQRGLQLELRLDAGIPARLVGDFERICQVLTNLVSNAIKFTPEGGVELVIELAEPATAAGPLRLRFMVADTGIGIPAAQQTEIFAPFAQADGSTTRKFGGTGLGLSISARLVAMMGGELELDSEPGVGSRFYFTLPLERPAPRTPIQDGALASLRARATPLRGAKLLLVEDNPLNRLVAETMLHSLGLEVVSASDGAEALARARTQRFDAVLMDVQMPRMDGLAATRSMRQLDGLAELPIIAMTAGAMASDREACLDAGMNDHLSKPLDSRALVEVLLRGLRLDRASD